MLSVNSECMCNPRIIPSSFLPRLLASFCNCFAFQGKEYPELMTEVEKLQIGSVANISTTHPGHRGIIVLKIVASTEESKFVIHHCDIRLTLEKHLSENSSLSALRWSHFRSITFVFFIFLIYLVVFEFLLPRSPYYDRIGKTVSSYDSHSWVPEMGSGSLVWHGVF